MSLLDHYRYPRNQGAVACENSMVYICSIVNVLLDTLSTPSLSHYSLLFPLPMGSLPSAKHVWCWSEGPLPLAGGVQRNQCVYSARACLCLQGSR